MQRHVHHVRSVSRQQIYDAGAPDIRAGSTRDRPCCGYTVSTFVGFFVDGAWLTAQHGVESSGVGTLLICGGLRWSLIGWRRTVCSFVDGVILSLRFTDNMVLMDCLGLLTLRVWSISGRKTHVLRICVTLVVASVVLLLLVSRS